jgi:hypothetical protein
MSNSESLESLGVNCHIHGPVKATNTPWGRVCIICAEPQTTHGLRIACQIHGVTKATQSMQCSACINPQTTHQLSIYCQVHGLTKATQSMLCSACVIEPEVKASISRRL